MRNNSNGKPPLTGCDLLKAGSDSLGLRLSQEQVDAFFTYLDLITLWNSRFNLTSIRKPETIIRLHFLDSLALAHFLDPEKRLMDLGSGAGLPGIPIKIFYPDKQVVLVEAHNKKANFLREVSRKLGIKAIRVVGERAEKLNLQEIGSFNEVVTRASGPIVNLIKISAPLLSPGGSCLIMGGPSGFQKFTAEGVRSAAIKLGFTSSRLEEYRLPLGTETRTLLSFTKK